MKITVWERLEFLFKVSFGTLATSANRHCVVFVEVCVWTCFVYVRTVFLGMDYVKTGQYATHAVWTL